MVHYLQAKVRTATLLLATVASLLVLDGCRGRKGKSRTAWRARTSRTVPASPAPTSPLTDAQMAQVVQAARSYTGTPYQTGGTTRVGMDCSGLVYVSFLTVNKTMPRISYQQAESGSPISESDIRPGDLVFFTDRAGNSKITHVGLVTEVRGSDTVKFIHTTNSLGVVENNLKQNYWHKLFLKAVRVR